MKGRTTFTLAYTKNASYFLISTLKKCGVDLFDIFQFVYSSCWNVLSQLEFVENVLKKMSQKVYPDNAMF